MYLYIDRFKYNIKYKIKYMLFSHFFPCCGCGLGCVCYDLRMWRLESNFGKSVLSYLKVGSWALAYTAHSRTH